MHPNNARVQESACKAIRPISGMKGLSEVRVIDVVLSAMRLHPDHLGIQKEACHALWDLADTEYQRELIVQKGGPELILEAIRKFNHNPAFAELAMGSLGNIAVSGPNQMTMAEKGVIEVVLDTTRLHLKDSSVQEQALTAVQNLGATSSNAVFISRSGGIELIISVMNAHSDDIDLQKRACSSLYNLAIPTMESKKMIFNQNGLKTVLQAMKTHPPLLLNSRCCSTLVVLAEVPKQAQCLSYMAHQNPWDKELVTACDATSWDITPEDTCPKERPRYFAMLLQGTDLIVVCLIFCIFSLHILPCLKIPLVWTAVYFVTIAALIHTSGLLSKVSKAPKRRTSGAGAGLRRLLRPDKFSKETLTAFTRRYAITCLYSYAYYQKIHFFCTLDWAAPTNGWLIAFSAAALGHANIIVYAISASMKQAPLEDAKNNKSISLKNFLSSHGDLVFIAIAIAGNCCSWISVTLLQGEGILVPQYLRLVAAILSLLDLVNVRDSIYRGDGDSKGVRATQLSSDISASSGGVKRDPNVLNLKHANSGSHGKVSIKEVTVRTANVVKVQPCDRAD